MMGKPYANFVAELTTLGRKCKKTPEQMAEALKKKVSDKIAKSIAKIVEPPAPSNYDAWAKKCQRLWDKDQEYQHNFEQKGPSHLCLCQDQNQTRSFQPQLQSQLPLATEV
jgi:3-polyprenyl-4-hydroxybenzoate decarboxylase